MRRILRHLIPLVAIFAVVGMLRVLEAATTLTGQLTIPSPTMVMPGPILTGQALRLGESTTTLPYSGSGLQRPVGSFLYDRNGALAYVKTGSTATAWEKVTSGSIGGGANSAGATTVRASQLTGISPALLTCFRDDLVTFSTATYSVTLTGSGVVNQAINNVVGGWLFTATGTTAASRGQVKTNGTVLGPPLTGKFYFAARAAFSAAIDAQTIGGVGLFDVTGNKTIALCVVGPTSTTLFQASYDSTGTCNPAGTVVSTGVSINTAPHVFEIWGIADGAVHFAVDATEIPGSPFSQVAAPTNSMRPLVDVLNQATATNREIDTDWIQTCWSQT